LTNTRDVAALTDKPQWAQELRRLYDNDIERVDLMVGMYAERRPQGFRSATPPSASSR
jgi:hypothetical protein